MTVDDLKLHLGCGEVYLDGWVNVDIESKCADVLHDLRCPLPFEDSSVSYIYAEHFIEHLTQSDAKKLLIECRRVLRDNGVIRLTTPNLFFLLAAYLSDELTEWSEYWMPATKAHMVNEGMRSWGHCFLYDSEELTRFLIECGFYSLKFECWHESEIYEFKNIENRNYHKELIIEATKVNRSDSVPQVDFSKLRVEESDWNSMLNDSKIELIKKAQAYASTLLSIMDESEDKQKKYINDLHAHIANQDVFIKSLKNHIGSLECLLASIKE